MNVVRHPSSPLPPDELLEKAKGRLQEVIIIGITNDGYEYFDCTVNSDCMWLLERTKLNLLSNHQC